MHKQSRTLAFVVAVSASLFVAACTTAPTDPANQSEATVVTAQTIASLPAGQSYVADVSGGRAYELDRTEGPIDYSRVIVRQEAGDLNLGDAFTAAGHEETASRLRIDAPPAAPSHGPAPETTCCVRYCYQTPAGPMCSTTCGPCNGGGGHTEM